MMRVVDDRSLPFDIGRAGPVLVLFSAAWCPPCRKAESEAAALAVKLPGVPVWRAELDEAQHMALAADLRGVPSLVLYRDGGLAGVRLGFASAGQWAEWVQQQLAPVERERAA
jgi:thioredoxin 1